MALFRQLRRPQRWLFVAVLSVLTASTATAFARQEQSPPRSPERESQGDVRPATDKTVVGFVRTPSGTAVPGATVRISNGTNKAWVTWTDESGKFEFPPLPAGPYRVEASQLGFAKTDREVQLPTAGNALALVLRVATLAELTAPAGPNPSSRSNTENSKREGRGEGMADNAPNGRRGNGQGNLGQDGRGGFGGREQVPVGVANAIRQGMAGGGGGGFAQTDLTGQIDAGGQEEAVGQPNAAQPGAAELAPGNGVTSSSDSFLLQGTVGQGLAENELVQFGPGGRGGGPGGVDDLAPQAPGGMSGGPGGPGGPSVPGGGGRVLVGRGGGRFAGGGPGPGRFRVVLRGPGGGRLGRQSVNRIRFSLYNRYSNSAFDAKPYSITGNEFPKISNYDERIGGVLGGPLKIPHIYDGSDRTFIFVNFQHETQQSPVNTFSTVPTQAEREGDFCGLGITLYDPLSNFSGPRTPLGNGCQIPAINSAAQGLLSYIPMPNIPGQTIQNFLLQTTAPVNTDRVGVHILHTINSKFNVNAGYNLNSNRANTFGNFPDIRGQQSTRSQSLDLGLSHNWTSRLVENLQLNWSRNRVQTLSDNSYTNNIAGNIGIGGISTDPINYGLPGIQFTSFSGFNDPVPSRVRDQTLRFSDGWTWVRANHTFTFGGEIRRIELNSDSDPNPRGQFRFTGVMTTQLNANGQPAAPLTPATEPYYELADFLLGLPYNTSAQFGSPNAYFRSWGFIAYAQDDWRVNKRFTFQYGVRYQVQTPPVELHNHIVNLDLNATATAVAVVTPNEIGPFNGAYPRALIHGNAGNWAPRIGFAWEPNIRPKTVVRAGYSIFYNESIYDSLAQKYLAYQPPFDVSQNWLTSAAQLLTLQQGFPGQAQSNSEILNTAGVSPFYQIGYAQTWMLGTETSFTQDWILDLTYTGTKGTDLDLLRAPNRAPLGTSQLDTQAALQIPYATSFYYDQSGANSIYNALQVRVVHRFTHGLMLQGMYTYSKSLDNASSIGGSTPVVVQQDGNYAAERGLSSFDMRHQFRLFSMYELPLGERSRWANHGWKKHAFGNWRLLNIITWHTGTPLTALLGGNASNNSGTGSNFSERTDQIAAPDLGICGGPALGFFNTAAFAAPLPGEYGDEHRGAIEGPCQFNWSLSLAKSFRFGPEQRHTLNASWEIQNLANTANFSGVGTALGSTTFGRVTSVGSMRTMDFMIRFNY
jgi:Carboxypeptidase regulatory-like domain